MRKSLIFLITFFLISIKSIHAYSTDPQEFVKGLINDVISKLSDKTLPENDKIEFIVLLLSIFDDFDFCEHDL